jgi:hypothetical protein
VKHFLLLFHGIVLLACDGYADLPVALRERADLQILDAPRFSEGPSRVEILLSPPSDAIGPFTVVGPPTALSEGAEVLSWAFGPCDASPSPALHLCLAMRFTSETPLALALVLESRGDARRFTLFGREDAP